MYRYIVILILTLGVTGCTGLAKIKERHHIAPFEKNIEKGSYNIKLYSINYPHEYKEKLVFYEKFDILMKKMILYGSTANIMYPEELKKDFFQLKKSALLPEELVFSKASSELSQKDRETIDHIVKIKLDKKLGNSQYYLNKQVYFWMKANNSLINFDNQEIYSELDKERLVVKIEDKRKKMLEIMEQVDINSILKIENPYSKNEDSSWHEKDVYINNLTSISPEIFKNLNYIYLNDIINSDVKKIVGGEIVFSSNIVVIKNKLYKGYFVKNNKYIFFTGGSIPIDYYEGYSIRVEVQNVELKDILTVDEKLLLGDFINFHNLKKREEL